MGARRQALLNLAGSFEGKERAAAAWPALSMFNGFARKYAEIDACGGGRRDPPGLIDRVQRP